MCTVLLPPGGYPIAVKDIISYSTDGVYQFTGYKGVNIPISHIAMCTKDRSSGCLRNVGNHVPYYSVITCNTTNNAFTVVKSSQHDVISLTPP